MNDFSDPETAIRTYLLWLEDPATLVDHDRIAALTMTLDGERDPIEKLRLLAELDRVGETDAERLRSAFVRHAKSWADANRVGMKAFRQLGVSDIALAEAGFDLGFGTKRTKGKLPLVRSKATQATRTDGGANAMKLREHVRQRTGTFTLTDVLAAVGLGSVATARNVVEGLVANGEVERLGPVKNHHKKGRAPMEYRRP